MLDRPTRDDMSFDPATTQYLLKRRQAILAGRPWEGLRRTGKCQRVKLRRRRDQWCHEMRYLEVGTEVVICKEQIWMADLWNEDTASLGRWRPIGSKRAIVVEECNPGDREVMVQTWTGRTLLVTRDRVHRATAHRYHKVGERWEPVA